MQADLHVSAPHLGSLIHRTSETSKVKVWDGDVANSNGWSTRAADNLQECNGHIRSPASQKMHAFAELGVFMQAHWMLNALPFDGHLTTVMLGLPLMTTTELRKKIVSVNRISGVSSSRTWPSLSAWKASCAFPTGDSRPTSSSEKRSELWAPTYKKQLHLALTH